MNQIPGSNHVMEIVLALDQVLERLGLHNDDVLNVYLHGSRLWGTADKGADYDFIIVMKESWIPASPDPLIEVQNVDAFVYNRLTFEEGLRDHILYLLLCLCLPPQFVWLERHKFTLDISLPKLRSAISKEAARTWTKAKKKWNWENNKALARKDMIHAIRDLILGAELAQTGTIKDFGAANEWAFEMKSETSEDWEYYKRKYQPIYNSASSRLKSVAPKEKNVEPRRTFLLNPTSKEQLEELQNKLQG